MKKYLTLFSPWLILALFVCFLCLPQNSFADWIQDIDSQFIQTRDIEASGNLSVSGHVRRVPDTSSYSTLRATNTISPYHKSFIVINGTGTISMSSTPTISTSPAYSGQELLILGGTNAVTFFDDGTLSGSLLELGASSRTLSSGTWLDLVYYSGKWYERYNPAYNLDQSLNTTDAVTFATVNTGQGANELYDMDQNVMTTSNPTFNMLTITGGIGAQTATLTGAFASTTVDTGQGANELYDMDQNVMTTSEPTFTGLTLVNGITSVTGTFSGAISATTLNTGQGANELYDMDQNVMTTSEPTFTGLTLVNGITSVTGTFSGAITATTLNTGQGANELYDMDQNLMVADSPTFHNVTANSGITAVTATVSGAATMYSIGATSGITAGWYIGLKNRTKAQLEAIRPDALGLMFYCSDCTEPTIVVSTGTTELGQFGALDVATW